MRTLVDSNPTYFQGPVMETQAALEQTELALSIELPEDLKWLLLHWGYGHCTIIANLQESVAITTRFRKYAGLPSQFLVLEDLHDAGVVLLNTQSDFGAVTWLGVEQIEALQQQKESELADVDHFATLALWCAFKLDEVIEEDGC